MPGYTATFWDQARSHVSDHVSRDIAPPAGGVTRLKYREASFDGADEVVVQDQEKVLTLIHHPSPKAELATFLIAHPPLLAGLLPNGPVMTKQLISVGHDWANSAGIQNYSTWKAGEPATRFGR
jgi:hypothetical protein